MPAQYENGVYKMQKVTDFASFSSGQSFDISLIQGRNVSFLKGTLEVTYSVPEGKSAPSDPKEDGLARLVSNLKLQYGGGAGVPIEFLTLQQANYYGNLLFGGALRNNQPTDPGVGSSNTDHVDFIITPSLRPYDPQVLEYAIPGEADHVYNMKLAGTWGTISTLFGTVNDAQIDSATLEITTEAGWSFSPDMSAMRNALGIDSNGYLYIPIYTSGTMQINQATSGLGLNLEIPTDVIQRRLMMLVKDSSGGLSDSIVSSLALKTSGNENLFGEIDFDEFQQISSERQDLDPYTGVLLIDMTRDVRDPFYAKFKDGLQLQKQDKLTVGFTTTAAGQIDYLYDAIRKIKVF